MFRRIAIWLLVVWSSLLSAEQTSPLTIKFVSNYEPPTKLKQFFSQYCNLPEGRWNNLQITDAEEADYYCLINFPMPGISYVPAKTIHVSMEAFENRKTFFPQNWIEPDPRQFLYDFDARNSLEWHLGKSYSELSKEEIKKNKLLSGVISSEYRLPGHIKRINFLQYLDSINFCYDLYGFTNKFNLKQYQGPLPFRNKNDGLLPYKYSIAIENCWAKGYFTEKLVDVILAEGLCFYYGCPDLESYIDPRAFIRIDIEHPEQVVKTIQQAIASNEWEKRIEVIRAEKNRILNELQMMPVLERIIQTHQKHMEDVKKAQFYEDMPVRVINLDRRLDRWKKFVAEADREHLYLYTRFPAVDGKTLVWNDNLDRIFQIPPNFKGKRWQNMTHCHARGVLGCAISHLALWIELAASQNEAMLIFEDDAELSQNFIEKWNAIYDKLRSDPKWDITYLAFHDDTPETQKKYGDTVVFEGVMQFSPAMRVEGSGTCAYCIRKKGALKLIEIASKQGIQQPIDHFMIDQFDTMCVYRTYPHLVTDKIYGITGTDTDVQN